MYKLNKANINCKDKIDKFKNNIINEYGFNINELKFTNDNSKIYRYDNTKKVNKK